jgi:hypothetical protein
LVQREGHGHLGSFRWLLLSGMSRAVKMRIRRASVFTGRLGLARVDLVLLLGQCVGHDSATMARLGVPVACVAAKDRVLTHNIVAALYELGQDLA